MIVILVLMTYVPDIVMFIPNLYKVMFIGKCDHSLWRPPGNLWRSDRNLAEILSPKPSML